MLNSESSNELEFKRGGFFKSLFSSNIKNTRTLVSIKAESGFLVLTYNLKPMGILLPEDEVVIYSEIDNFASYLTSLNQKVFLQETIIKNEEAVGKAVEATSELFQPNIYIAVASLFAIMGIGVNSVVSGDETKIAGAIIGGIVGFIISVPLSKRIKG